MLDTIDTLMIARSEKKRYAWGTEAELSWLDTIGTTARENNPNYDVATALRGYISASYQRRDWMDIDRDVCVNHARELLAGV